MTAADLVVRGRIASLAGTSGLGWVGAFAVCEGRIVAAGSVGDVEAAVGPRTRHLVVGPDLVVLPGLTDAHLHLADAALAAQRVDLEAAASLADGAALVASAAGRSADPDAWIEGGGWDPARWGRWPRASDLGEAAAGRRVALWSHDHHAMWVSERVLAELHLDASVADPPGGCFRRGADGDPDGILQESAAQVVISHLRQPSGEVLRAAIRSYTADLLALGIVGVHDPGDLLADADLSGGFAAAVALAEAGDLPIRVHTSIREPALGTAIERGLRTGDALDSGAFDGVAGRVRMGWLKLFADGALGSRTALLLDPYAGTSGRGIALTSEAHLIELARRASEAGIVPQIHAIGDAALRAALNALEPVAPRTGPMARIEHVQFADPSDLPRLAASRIAASIQPIHLRSDVEKAHEAWGERAEERGFLLHSLYDAGITVAFGTDAPVEPADPWPGIALAITRVAPEWRDGRPFGPAQAISLERAVRAATVGPAITHGDPLGGRLVPGSPADFIAIPAAALSEPVAIGGPLATTRPSFVVIGGTTVVER